MLQSRGSLDPSCSSLTDTSKAKACTKVKSNTQFNSYCECGPSEKPLPSPVSTPTPVSDTPPAFGIKCHCNCHLYAEENAKAPSTVSGSTEVISPLKKNHKYLPSFFTDTPRASQISSKIRKSSSLNSLVSRLAPTSMRKSTSMPKLNPGLSLDQPHNDFGGDCPLPLLKFNRLLLKRLSIRKMRSRRSSVRGSALVEPQNTEITTPKVLTPNNLRLNEGLYSIQERTHEAINVSPVASLRQGAQVDGSTKKPKQSENGSGKRSLVTPENSFANSLIDCYAEDYPTPRDLTKHGDILPGSLTSSPTRSKNSSNSVTLKSPTVVASSRSASFDESIIAGTVTYEPQSQEPQHLMINNNSSTDFLDLKRECHSTPVDEDAAFSTPPLGNTEAFPPYITHAQRQNNVVDELSFDDVSHSTSAIDSIVPLMLFTDKSSMYNEQPTVKEVNNIEVFRTNHNLRVVSPWSQKLASISPNSIETFNTVETERSEHAFNDKLRDIGEEEPVLTKDEVYRREMLALIERHTTMVNKQQIEINNLRRLLLKERLVNLALSSPQLRVDSPKLPLEIRDSKPKIRHQFIPLNITLTDDPKRKTPLEGRLGKDLLPPFSVMMNKTILEKKPEEFTLKPFSIKHRSSSLRFHEHNEEMSYLIPGETKGKTARVQINSATTSVMPLGGIVQRKCRRSSTASSLYFTADEDFDEQEDETEPFDEAHPNPRNARDCSGSTVSSLMSQVKINDSANTSVSSIETFNIIKD